MCKGGACDVMVIIVENGYNKQLKSWTKLFTFHIALKPLKKASPVNWGCRIH